MRALLLSTLVFAGAALAQDTTTPTPPPAPPAETPPAEAATSGFDKSKFVVRGGIHFDVGGAINLGGTSAGARAAVGANAGVGYFIVPRLELDLDAVFTLRFAPSPVAVERLELTPGARWRPIDQLQLRLGVPIPLVPQAGVGILGGVAYVQPLGSRVSLVVGADYTYYFTEYWRQVAPQGRIEFHGGVQAYL
ncbi:MAG: hypothetical protein AB1730_06545 [Myxococcota bacterium]|jgi:hypothetical protein